MSATQVNILMTGGGAPGAPGILRCLQSEPAFQVILADASPAAVGRYLHNDFELIPKADDPAFTETLLEICLRRGVQIIMPLVTKELLLLARYKDIFEKQGTKILVSPLSSLEIANNKSNLYRFLDQKGLNLPAYRIVEDIAQFRQAVSELGFPEKDICFKPSVSNGSRGFRIISSQADEADLLFNHKPGHSFISLADATRILGAAPFPELLVSEYLPGDEFSVDCLAAHGDTLLAVPRKRIKMVNGISVEGQIIREENIICYCTKIIELLQLHGNIGIQVKADRQNNFMILEINPRVQGTIVAGLGAGINLPVLAIKKELDLPVHPTELHIKWGTHFIRYWSEVFFEE